MDVLFGDNAPTLEEQGLDLFIEDIQLYQTQLEDLLTKYDVGSISFEELEDKLSNIAAYISDRIDEVISNAGDDCIFMLTDMSVEH